MARTRACRAFQRGGAASSWFSKEKAADTTYGIVKSSVACLVGMVAINFICRGNVMGRCKYASEVDFPIQRTKVHVLPGHGFVGGDEAEGMGR